MKAGGAPTLHRWVGYTEMIADGRARVSKVMVILSDSVTYTGQNCAAKNANGTWPTSNDPHCKNPCGHAIADATAYNAAGWMIFTILYNDGQLPATTPARPRTGTTSPRPSPPSRPATTRQ